MCVRNLVRNCNRLFAKSGYRIALIARNPEHLRDLAGEINAAGGEVRTRVLGFGYFPRRLTPTVGFYHLGRVLPNQELQSYGHPVRILLH
jgi:hypothetical protein